MAPEVGLDHANPLTINSLSEVELLRKHFGTTI